ncbi:RNA/RNP complex-1-interacting phosphatase homolog isoform X1 [Achroia grisella]|uniref:RNA/RNP complex-1-interacting phosphatase homolog isoform X1 n=1 Tax=Achroia grisella TaxID=688607 RepID=UPI0027D2E3DC|nr:RNA/RNP complex-1-interacting phosphatase homolog isoform X1 [Achroia grisella]
MPPAIPDRWTAYKPCGKIIDGTRIICFKVPLRRNVQQGNNEINYIWDIPTLLRDVPKLGAVIDLTNTARYYNPRDLQEAGVLHKKILMPGRVIPPENKVIEFMDTVDEFLGKDCDLIIGVHCTHGLNRTGYMVCRYMRDRLGILAKDAIKKFEKGRGYQIERENYLADLLGQKLPPPDLGQSTEVKPIGMNYNMYRSPFGEYERNDYQSNEWYVRREGKFRTRKRISRWDAYEDSRRKRQRNDSSSSNRSYDYKYDY